jgi:LysM repeat protein
MPDPEKAFLEFEGGDKIPCLFNPDSISITRGNSWEGPSMPGKGVLPQEYRGASAGTMGLELDFDTTADGHPVTKYTGALLARMEVDKDLPGTDETSANARPPTVTFHWGQHLHSFPCVITSVTVNFTYFSSTGVPLRAHVSLALKQYKESDAFGPQNPTSGTPRPHRTHRVQPGETLDRITARYYGDATKWRLLATANGIEDPLALRPGSVITVPRLESK